MAYIHSFKQFPTLCGCMLIKQTGGKHFDCFCCSSA